MARLPVMTMSHPGKGHVAAKWARSLAIVTPVDSARSSSTLAEMEVPLSADVEVGTRLEQRLTERTR